jgi:hypothetical protein
VRESACLQTSKPGSCESDSFLRANSPGSANSDETGKRLERGPSEPGEGVRLDSRLRYGVTKNACFRVTTP